MILKNMTNLEEFFKNRITFKQRKFFDSRQKFDYLSNNIFTPEEYSLKFFLKKKLKLLHTICLVVIF